MTSEIPRWLQIAREIQAIGQTGLHFSETDYHRQRYGRLLELAAEIVQEKTGLEREPLALDFSRQPGYATPKVDVRGAIVREGRVLLVQERTDQLWCLPGGWADVGESPSEMVVREVWEESGFRVRANRLVGVFDANRQGGPLQFFHAYKLLFMCEIVEGEARPSDETQAVQFFARDQIPPLSLQRTAARHLEAVWNFAEDPSTVPVFD
ncbi:MAG: NUDIX hydrolase [Acidobacteriota bacterium]